MKYGLKEIQDSTPDDDKNVLSDTCLPDQSVVVEVKATELSDVNTAVNDESSEVPKPQNDTSQLPIDEPVITESITVNQIITTERSEICENFNVPTSTPIHTETPENCVQPTNIVDDQHQVQCETVAMVCDAIGSDAAALAESVMEVVTNSEETDPNMEVVTSNDESSVVEMLSHPPTPNDIDMFAVIEPQQETFVKSHVKYNLKNAPIVELSRYSWGTNSQKYLRGCIFSPDGTCILTTVNKDGMHIIELPLSLYENESVSADRPVDILTTAVHVSDCR